MEDVRARKLDHRLPKLVVLEADAAGPVSLLCQVQRCDLPRAARFKAMKKKKKSVCKKKDHTDKKRANTRQAINTASCVRPKQKTTQTQASTNADTGRDDESTPSPRARAANFTHWTRTLPSRALARPKVGTTRPRVRASERRVKRHIGSLVPLAFASCQRLGKTSRTEQRQTKLVECGLAASHHYRPARAAPAERAPTTAATPNAGGVITEGAAVDIRCNWASSAPSVL